MSNKMHVALAVVALAIWTTPAKAVLISEVASHDADLNAKNSVSQTTNTGNLTVVNLGWAGSGADFIFGIMKWSLGSVPSGYTAATNGTLTLTINGSSDNPNWHIYDIYLVNSANAAWAEASATWAKLNQGSSVDWTGGPGLGGFTEGLGYDATPLDSETWTTGQTTLQFTIPQSVLNGWLSGSNAGILIRDQDESWTNTSTDGFLVIRSSEHGTGPGPTLTFTAVPEPGSILLLGLGMIALVAQRRRRML
jgi:hypothetical protein